MVSNEFFYRLGIIFFSVFLMLFFSGFYITGFDNSSFSSILRVFLAIGLLLLFSIISVSGVRDCFSPKEYIAENSKFLYIALALFFFYILIMSVFFSDWSVFRRSVIVFCFLLIVGFYTFYLRFNYEFVINCLAVFGFFLGSLYLYNYFMVSEFSLLRYRNNPVQSTGLSWLASYDNTITAALHLSILCIATIWSYFYSKSKTVAAFFYVSFFILLSAIVFTFARTAWVAIFSSLFVFFLYEFKTNKLKVFYLYGVLVCLGLVYIYLFYGHDVSRGLSHRDEIWIGLLNNIYDTKSWVFGMGPAASVSFVKIAGSTIAVHAHNIYVETLYRNGILGVILFLLLLFFSIRSLVAFRVNDDKTFFVAVLCGASVSMFFDFSNLIYSPNLIWMWVWFPIAVSLFTRKFR